jgi:hypothetical protein
MLLSTTSSLEGQPIRRYLGLVHGETILGANIFRDILASIRDLIGGRARSYEVTLERCRCGGAGGLRGAGTGGWNVDGLRNRHRSAARIFVGSIPTAAAAPSRVRESMNLAKSHILMRRLSP